MEETVTIVYLCGCIYGSNAKEVHEVERCPIHTAGWVHVVHHPSGLVGNRIPDVEDDEDGDNWLANF